MYQAADAALFRQYVKLLISAATTGGAKAGDGDGSQSVATHAYPVGPTDRMSFSW